MISKKKQERMLELYASSLKRSEVQEILSKEFCVGVRQIRKYAKQLGLNTIKAHTTNDKVLVYDIETSRVKAKLWGTGKQYVGHNNLKSETKIISIAWKWIGEDKVHSVHWGVKEQDDKICLEKFLPEFNKASIIVGQNHKSFDNKIVKARAAKHRMFVNNFTTDVDIMRLAKSSFRLPSYSMAYMSKYFGLTLKQSHEGIHMWDMIEDGNLSERKEYLKKMIDYNVGDIITTEELYMTLRPYFKHVTHLGVRDGLQKWVCPNSGNEDVVLHDTKITAAGTVQRILFCESSNTQFKVSNKVYMDFLTRQL